MVPTISKFTILTLFASSALTSPLSPRKPPSLTYVDQTLEDVAGKACSAWSVWLHPAGKLVKPVCHQWVPDEKETSPFSLVTGIFEGTCHIWNVRVADSKHVMPECAHGEEKREGLGDGELEVKGEGEGEGGVGE